MASSSGFWKPRPVENKSDIVGHRIEEEGIDRNDTKKRQRISSNEMYINDYNHDENQDHQLEENDHSYQNDRRMNNRTEYGKNYRNPKESKIKKRGQQQQQQQHNDDDDNDQKNASVFRQEQRQQYNNESINHPPTIQQYRISQQRMILPIYNYKRQILYAIEQYGILIIVGETGTCRYRQEDRKSVRIYNCTSTCT
jgi:hypothetical protein